MPTGEVVTAFLMGFVCGAFIVYALGTAYNEGKKVAEEGRGTSGKGSDSRES